MTDQLSGGVVQPTDAQTACQVPLVELLKAVPRTARLVIEDGPYSTSFIPVGRYCHEAAEALAVPQAPLQAEPVPVVASEPDECPHGEAHIVHDCLRCGAPVCCDKCCAEDTARRATPQAEPAVAEQARDRFAAHTDLLTYVLQDDVHNRLTPRVIDIAYTAFMSAKQPNTEDGGSSDWFNDTRPTVLKAIDKLREALFADRAALASQSTPPPAAEQAQGLADSGESA